MASTRDSTTITAAHGGQVVEWLVEDGQRVGKGDRLLVVETEKTSTELESPADGVVRIRVPAGPELVPLDAVLGYIDSESG